MFGALLAAALLFGLTLAQAPSSLPTKAGPAPALAPQPLPCHHGGPCPPIPQQLAPQLHNTPGCLQTEGPHDIAATMTTVEADGSLLHHVFQFCIPCIYTSPDSTCWYNSTAHSNPNSQNGTWAVNNVGDAWQHATSSDLVHWKNHGNTIVRKRRTHVAATKCLNSRVVPWVVPTRKPI